MCKTHWTVIHIEYNITIRNTPLYWPIMKDFERKLEKDKILFHNTISCHLYRCCLKLYWLLAYGVREVILRLNLLVRYALLRQNRREIAILAAFHSRGESWDCPEVILYFLLLSDYLFHSFIEISYQENNCLV